MPGEPGSSRQDLRLFSGPTLTKKALCHPPDHQWTSLTLVAILFQKVPQRLGEITQGIGFSQHRMLAPVLADGGTAAAGIAGR